MGLFRAGIEVAVGVGGGEFGSQSDSPRRFAFAPPLVQGPGARVGVRVGWVAWVVVLPGRPPIRRSHSVVGYVGLLEHTCRSRGAACRPPGCGRVHRASPGFPAPEQA